MTTLRHLNAYQLDNRFGLSDAKTVLDAETLFIAAATLTGLPTGMFDLAHAVDMHAHLYGAMYPWAGSLRSANLSANAHRHHMSTAFDELVELDAHGMTLTDLGVCMAGAYAGIITSSPFPYGNEETARQLLGQFAHSRGAVVRWDRTSSEELSRAIGDYRVGNVASLQDLFADILSHQDLYLTADGATSADIQGRIIRSSGISDLFPDIHSVTPAAISAVSAQIQASLADLLKVHDTLEAIDRWPHTSFGLTAVTAPQSSHENSAAVVAPSRLQGPRH